MIAAHRSHERLSQTRGAKQHRHHKMGINVLAENVRKAKTIEAMTHKQEIVCFNFCMAADVDR